MTDAADKARILEEVEHAVHTVEKLVADARQTTDLERITAALERFADVHAQIADSVRQFVALYVEDIDEDDDEDEVPNLALADDEGNDGPPTSEEPF